VSDASSNVQITRAGVTTPVTPGTKIESGDIVITGAGSQAVLLLENGAVEVVMLENSEIHISSIWVELGEIFVRVKKHLSESFEVESEYGVAGVEGTEFMVRVSRGKPDVDTYQCITLAGRVRISSPAKAWATVSLAPGDAIAVNPGSAPKQRKLERKEFNGLVERVNQFEHIYRPGASDLAVPDVVGLMQPDAQRELKAQALSVNPPIGRVTGRVTIGQVVAQTPSAGDRVTAGSAVSIEVEAEPTTVPPTTGMPLEKAKQELARARLKTGDVTNQMTGNFPVGTVAQQSPSAGDRVPVDSAVNLWIEVASVKVPDLSTKTASVASRELSALGLRLGRTKSQRDNSKPGQILSQDPAAGTLIAPGSAVDIVVAESCTVPSVTGRSRNEATSMISAAGLKPRINSVGTYNSDSVTKQSPNAGSSVQCDSTVSIDLGTFIG
jgi:beta-lactam-binding protein with PASTA domain